MLRRLPAFRIHGRILFYEPQTAPPTRHAHTHAHMHETPTINITCAKLREALDTAMKTQCVINEINET